MRGPPAVWTRTRTNVRDSASDDEATVRSRGQAWQHSQPDPALRSRPKTPAAAAAARTLSVEAVCVDGGLEPPDVMVNDQWLQSTCCEAPWRVGGKTKQWGLC